MIFRSWQRMKGTAVQATFLQEHAIAIYNSHELACYFKIFVNCVLSIDGCKRFMIHKHTVPRRIYSYFDNTVSAIMDYNHDDAFNIYPHLDYAHAVDVSWYDAVVFATWCGYKLAPDAIYGMLKWVLQEDKVTLIAYVSDSSTLLASINCQEWSTQKAIDGSISPTYHVYGTMSYKYTIRLCCSMSE
jgi:hypothetical protein